MCDIYENFVQFLNYKCINLQAELIHEAASNCPYIYTTAIMDELVTVSE